ncbi:hypothetical protein MY494_09300 [Synechococcus sp. A10-1-5-1]|uniref:hypothetical protein n=1 Tax=Synechococcus sp. A10-1-5-1 TaxID=2936507 RepID=UPI0020005BE3|nr:hypothetical protein [Synechococcus sp. A10-1-5-1]UPM49531.1 hypothetical protein MY494_09300 [Synechococcus sp. A10-1-5-1]
MSSLRSTNTSKAYWELKAEQVMDRVFHPSPPQASKERSELQEAIEVDVREATPTQASRPTPTARFQSLHSKQWLFAALLLCALGGGVGLWQGWNTAQRQLRLERNARLLSDLRNLKTSEKPTSSDSLPPPPVEEAWIAQLPPLPAVPAPPEIAATSPQPVLPELVGVVQIPGQRGSAIFQQGTSSSNALVGEQIGSSGWRLISIQSDGALIERNGMRRRVSIGAGL